MNGPLRVGIGGPVGAGKTTLTAELAKALLAEGIDYIGIDIRDSSLEDIFVSLLGEEAVA